MSEFRTYTLKQQMESDHFCMWFRDGYVPSAAKEILAGIQISAVLDEGGEGEGDHAEMVRKIVFPDGHEELVRVTGSYASYDGFEWNYYDMHLCQPVEKTITVYEPI